MQVVSDSDGRPGRLVRQVGQILEGTRVAMERMRVACSPDVS